MCNSSITVLQSEEINYSTLPGTRSRKSTDGPSPACHFNCSTVPLVDDVLAGKLASMQSSMALFFAGISDVLFCRELLEKVLEEFLVCKYGSE